MTKIQWTDETWNPTRGCTRVSAGCEHCYAERVAHRFSGPGQPYEGLTRESGRWAGVVDLVPEKLDEPLHWRKPRRVFVDSMSDVFHDQVPDSFISNVMHTIWQTPQHTYQILTKRPERARACVRDWLGELPPNVWLGVSCEDQKAADERIPLLLQTPAAVRFVSAEPLLGRLDLSRWLRDWSCPECRGTGILGFGGGVRRCPQVCHRSWVRSDPRLSWIIAGGESGPGARPCRVEWIRSIVAQCRQAGVACFVKQLGARPEESGEGWFFDHRVGEIVDCDTRPVPLRSRKGDDPSEWPEDLRVQEYPDAPAPGRRGCG